MAHILVVDDDRNLRQLLQTALEASGHSVDVADHGGTALSLARRCPPQALVTDAMMPQMDGFALTRHWRSDPQLHDIPIIMYTGAYTDRQDRALAVQVGVTRFLTKPIHSAELLDAVSDVLTRTPDPHLLPPTDDVTEDDSLRDQNRRLVRHLQRRMHELEASNQALQCEAARHQQALARLARSEARYRLLADNALDVIFRCHLQPELVCDYISPSVQRLAGRHPADFYDDPTLLLRSLHPDDRAAFLEILQAGPSSDKVLTSRWVDDDGTVQWAEVRLRVSVDDAGALVVEGIARDCTDRVEQERQEELLRAQLLQAQKMESLGTLAGGVAHDFNNMLMVIRSYTELVYEELPEDDPMRRDLATVMNAADSSASLTQQLLAFSRRQVASPRKVKPWTVLERLERMLRRIIGEDIALTLHHTSCEHLVYIDPGHFEQALINLAVNARDAMPQGGRLSFEVDCCTVDAAQARSLPPLEPGRYVRVRVHDTGQGMDRATAARVFEPFFTTKRDGKGTGLGLATVYGIVRQAAGRVWVDSAPGEGTCFTILLPVAASDVEDYPQMDASPPSSLDGDELVLVVDDEAAVAELLRRVLVRHGYEVVVATNAGEALLQGECSDRSIDLLLTDVVLPLLNGVDLATRLRRHHPELRVVFMTGHLTHDTLSAVPGDQLVPVMVKPFTPEEIALRVRLALDSEPVHLPDEPSES